jgi:hypothetical protein
MVIGHANGLHVGICDRATNEAKSMFFEIFAYVETQGGRSWYLF